MHDPYILIGRFAGISLWHRDKDGVDGRCGWFMRANHGSEKVLKAIESRYKMDWSNQCKTHNLGVTQTALFDEHDFAAMSAHGIAINLFFCAAYEHLGHDRSKTAKFMKDNLYEILFFAENPVDSAHTSWFHIYGYDENRTREERIHATAAMIYGWILRATRPWYRHPRWHVHHWRLGCDWARRFSSKRERCGVAAS